MKIVKPAKSIAVSAISMLVGFFLSLPFIVDMFVLGNSYHHITLVPGLEIAGLVFGGPLFLLGMSNHRSIPARSASTNDVDVARIRYAAEAEMLRKK